jgi:hypothetical protein
MVEELGIDYHSPTFYGAILETYESLKRVAYAAREPLTAECAGIELVDTPATVVSKDGKGGLKSRISVVAALGA